MKNIQFFEAMEVKESIKKLCENKAFCTCGIKYYVTDIKDAKKYVVDATNRVYYPGELEAIYHSLIIEQKIVKEVIENLPDINIEFEDWDFVNMAKYGIYENDSLELGVKNNLLTIDLRVTEKFDNSFEVFDSPGYYTKGNLNIEIKNAIIESEDFDTINILDQDYNNLIKAIIKNILV